MSQINPYQSPRADSAPPIRAKLAGVPDGVWRLNNLMVIRVGTVLPPVCLKSNQPTPSRWRRTFSWHPPWIIVTILAGLLVYLILALVLTKRATFDLPISDEFRRRRRRGLLIGWLIALAGLAFFIGAIALGGEPRDNPVFGMALMSVLIAPLIGFIVGSFAGRLIWPSKIDDYYAYLKGVSPEYLEQLPPWPGG